MQPILRLVDGDAAGRIHHRVGRLDVAAQRQAVGEHAVIGLRHLGLVDDEVLEAVTDRLLGLPVAEIRQRAPTLGVDRSEEHTSELQSLMSKSYAVFRLHTKNSILQYT